MNIDPMERDLRAAILRSTTEKLNEFYSGTPEFCVGIPTVVARICDETGCPLHVGLVEAGKVFAIGLASAAAALLSSSGDPDDSDEHDLHRAVYGSLVGAIELHVRSKGWID
ncbi:MAG: hypothetical protein E6R03_12660 [Hyphomicrobiaceae bacterium]|nr:MAG: hypothetical protein E6R03_12660 [Hyphomicrobiaceae bacterium]